MRGHPVIGIIFSMIPIFSKSMTVSPPLLYTILFKGNTSIPSFFLVSFAPILKVPGWWCRRLLHTSTSA